MRNDMPVAKETLRATVKNYIVDQIVQGKYRPGDRIVETRISKELGLSQAPVREAILELSTAGLLEVVPYSGTRVRVLTAFDIEDMFSVRAYIEEHAVRKATQKITEEKLAYLKGLLGKMSKDMSISEFAEVDNQFHTGIMEAAENPALLRAWSQIRMTEWTVICAQLTDSTLQQLIDEHWHIYHLLESRDDHKAGAFMYLHISRFSSEVIRYYEMNKESDEKE